MKEFCENHANYKGCKKESKPADEIGRACCMAHNAACNACALNMTKEEYCSTEKNYDVDGCTFQFNDSIYDMSTRCNIVVYKIKGKRGL